MSRRLENVPSTPDPQIAMKIQTAWDNLSHAVAEMQSPSGDPRVKLSTVLAAVELLFEHPVEQILEKVEKSPLPNRATVSWLVFEGGRLTGVPAETVRALRELYEATCPPGQGIIPPPQAWAKSGHA